MNCPHCGGELSEKQIHKIQVRLEEDYPHDERCEGSMCYCANRAKSENPEKWKKYIQDNEVKS
jgi:hypothetical protein